MPVLDLLVQYVPKDIFRNAAQESDEGYVPDAVWYLTSAELSLEVVVELAEVDVER